MAKKAVTLNPFLFMRNPKKHCLAAFLRNPFSEPPNKLLKILPKAYILDDRLTALISSNISIR